MAAKTRDQLRVMVRTQLDMAADELPDTTIDLWLEDGYERTLAIDERWPFLEHQWPIVTVADQNAYTKAALAVADVDGYVVDKIISVTDFTDTRPSELAALPHTTAELEWGGVDAGSGVPVAWSEWGGSIYLWPAPAVARDVRVRGFRRGKWDAGSAVTVDADDRLHVGLYFFACAQAYAQQEDEVLSAKYMQDWADAVGRAQKSIMSDVQRGPIVMSGGGVRYGASSVRLVP